MIIGMTGHTANLGKTIAEFFQEKGHIILGFALENGYDISKPGIIPQIVSQCQHVDVFINCAYWRTAQTDLLYAFYDVWKDDESKTIMNLGSNIGDVTRDYRYPYAIFKGTLDDAVAQLQNCKPACRIMIIRPGYVDTPIVENVKANKLEQRYVAEVMHWMIEQPALIRSLTVTHNHQGRMSS